ncbi:hypothetical protein NPIL_318471 [Nephila pilipes]|uniref:Uncharacterized protein n=1 Tax=Nephila pilipes TaxID=299642 RepID=A0A8X6MUE8_NEPPI|nr:hypothetical protein NPIL_318471 [Nephila pilipes]
MSDQPPIIFMSRNPDDERVSGTSSSFTFRCLPTPPITCIPLSQTTSFVLLRKLRESDTEDTKVYRRVFNFIAFDVNLSEVHLNKSKKIV